MSRVPRLVYLQRRLTALRQENFRSEALVDEAVMLAARSKAQTRQLQRDCVGALPKGPRRETYRFAPADDPRSPESPAHDDWLLDEALAETFPASDPISPACHGR